MTIIKATKKFRCKAKCGRSFKWSVGTNSEGKFKALSVGEPRPPMPMDFAPFEILDAVLNRALIFDTEQEAMDYVKSL